MPRVVAVDDVVTFFAAAAEEGVPLQRAVIIELGGEDIGEVERVAVAGVIGAQRRAPGALACPEHIDIPERIQSNGAAPIIFHIAQEGVPEQTRRWRR